METWEAINPGQRDRAKEWETCSPMKTITASFAKLSRAWGTTCDAQLSSAARAGHWGEMKCSVAEGVRGHHASRRLHRHLPHSSHH